MLRYIREEEQFQGIIILGANFHGEFFQGAIFGGQIF